VGGYGRREGGRKGGEWKEGGREGGEWREEGRKGGKGVDGGREEGIRVGQRVNVYYNCSDANAKRLCLANIVWK